MFGLFSLGLPALIFTVVMCIHVVRTNQQLYWIFIILVIPGFGPLVYFVAIVLPELLGGTTARRVGAAARSTLDPERDYRRAKADQADSPTAGANMRLAHAAMALKRYDEAEALYRDAAQGIHAEDPTLLLGRANALLELGRPADALAVLDVLSRDPDQGRSPQTALAQGRAFEGLGRVPEADAAYQRAAEHLPGLEAMARYAAFKARNGRRDEAKQTLADLDARISRMKGGFRAEARVWRDLTAQAIS
jgi:hypothetical protein